MLRVMTIWGRMEGLGARREKVEGYSIHNLYQACLWPAANSQLVLTLRRMKLTLWVEQHPARQVIGHARAALAQHLLVSQPLAALAVKALLVVAASRRAQAINRVRPEMHSPMLLGVQGMLLHQVCSHPC